MTGKIGFITNIARTLGRALAEAVLARDDHVVDQCVRPRVNSDVGQRDDDIIGTDFGTEGGELTTLQVAEVRAAMRRGVLPWIKTGHLHDSSQGDNR